MSQENNKSDKKNEIEELDVCVKNFKLPVEICPGTSDHVSKEERIAGEQLFVHDFMFLVKRIANVIMGIDASVTLNWSPTEARQFYLEHRLSNTYDFHDTFMDEGNKKSIVNWYFKGRGASYMRFLAYRWNHSMAFLTYRERCDVALEMRVGEDAESATVFLEKIAEAKEAQAALNSQVELWKSQKGVPEQLINLLDGIEISLVDLINNGD